MPTHTFAFGIGPWELGIVLIISIIVAMAKMLEEIEAELEPITEMEMADLEVNSIEPEPEPVVV